MSSRLQEGSASANASKKLPRIGRYVALCLAIAAALFAASFYLLTDKALLTASNVTQNVVTFARQSIQSYEGSVASSRTKGLTEVWEKIEELNDRYDLTDESAAMDKALDKFLDTMTLDAVLLLDSNRQMVRFAGDKTAAQAIAAASKDSTNLDGVVQYSNKSYLSRVTLGGSTYDVASCASSSLDGGILIGANRMEAGDLSNDAAVFRSMFDGYVFSLGGTVAVTDDDIVLASNDLSLIGTDRASFDAQLALGQDREFYELSKGSYNGTAVYGLQTTSSGYDVFVWSDEQSVMAQRNTQLVVGFVLYLLVIAAIFVAKSSVQNARIRREREYTESLERANMAKTDFLRRMSHDVRTPINGIRGMLAIGDHYAQDMDKQAECRRKMWEASSFLLELVNSALDMNKLESGQIKLEHKPFDVRNLVSSLVDVIQVQADQLDISLSCEAVVEHRYLLGSPLHLRQVLQNIGGNAIKYNKEGGFVRFECREIDSGQDWAKIRFVCEDGGIGMSEEFQKHAFEAFAQEDSNARTAYQGTGLGLAICRELVEQMGGTITLESTKGVGSKFTIDLLFDIDPNQGAALESHEDGPAASAAGMRVLLAEDNELNMEVASFMLQQLGVAADKASDGQQALECFKASDEGFYDAVLMDVMMPVMDGFEAARAIRALDRADAKTVPIIAVTANAFTDDMRQSSNAGMTDHVSKPLDAKQLARALAAARR